MLLASRITIGIIGTVEISCRSDTDDLLLAARVDDLDDCGRL